MYHDAQCCLRKVQHGKTPAHTLFVKQQPELGDSSDIVFLPLRRCCSDSNHEYWEPVDVRLEVTCNNCFLLTAGTEWTRSNLELHHLVQNIL